MAAGGEHRAGEVNAPRMLAARNQRPYNNVGYATGERPVTQLLEQALEQVRQLPDAEQDAIAALMLEEIRSEERWQAAFAGSQD